MDKLIGTNQFLSIVRATMPVAYTPHSVFRTEKGIGTSDYITPAPVMYTITSTRNSGN